MELGSEQLTENSIRKLNGNNNSSNPAIFPYVILNAGISVDGKIAARDGSSNISSGHDLKIVQKLRSEVDAIMVGINTVLRDNPLLTNRTGVGKKPPRIIIDSKCRIPPQFSRSRRHNKQCHNNSLC